MHQLAAELDRGLQQGHSLADQLARYRFLTPEFSLIVFQGEAKGRLGAELVLYSRLTRKRFYQKVEKMLHLLQPLIFLFVALLIVSVYAAMFLPLYGNLNEIKVNEREESISSKHPTDSRFEFIEEGERESGKIRDD